MTVLYGIPNCDTVKKARVWLQEHGVEYEFSDFKKQPPTEGDIRAWLADVPSDTLLNRRGTTWRKLSEAERAAADNEDGAVRLMCARAAEFDQTPRAGAWRAVLLRFSDGLI